MVPGLGYENHEIGSQRSRTAKDLTADYTDYADK
jgi:hypothetical protein